MKIGILTYHRSHNYGALLQAVALRHVLAEMGHEAFFIDYWPEYHKDIYRVVSRQALRGLSLPTKLRRITSTLLRYRYDGPRRKRFFEFIRQYIEPHCRPMHERMDLVVCGSDQIWRKQSRLGGHFNPVYFGEDIPAAKCFASYAASMGIIDINEADRADLRRWLSKFSDVSVRESDLAEALREAGVENVRQVVDPTLLLDADGWRRLMPVDEGRPERRYALFYDLMPDSFDLTAIRRFCAARGLELKIMPGVIRNLSYPKEYLTACGPLEMLRLIANADLVFTSSFHGLVFSIIFNRPFMTAFAKNAGRAASLLQATALQERLLTPMANQLPDCADINFPAVNARLEALRSASFDFLKTTLDHTRATLAQTAALEGDAGH